MDLEMMIQVMKSWMEGEINNFIKVWLLALSSLSLYYFFTAKIIPKGHPKLLLLHTIPVICLNLILPFYLHSMHLGITTAFFLAWLANFKLLMFCYGKGPLSHKEAISLGSFLVLASFPIKIKSQNDPKSAGVVKPTWNYGLKILLIPLLLKVYGYNEFLHPWFIMTVYCIHIYVGLEIIFAILGVFSTFFLGVELEPQFNDPYLSTSLQDFWGKRWNIMVTRILRPSVYEPFLSISTRFVGRKWAPLPAIFSTFMVSGIMHELIFYYLGRRWPTWEISCFFLLHGVCLMLEVGIKKLTNGRIKLPRIIAAPLTVGFVMVTGFWLFFPEFFRHDSMERTIKESAAIKAFVVDVKRALTFKSH